jgi:hypothetical protein
MPKGNAAFRDGLYLAKLHAQNGQAPQLSVGRWSIEEDRRDFVAGYQRGVLELNGNLSTE